MAITSFLAIASASKPYPVQRGIEPLFSLFLLQRTVISRLDSPFLGRGRSLVNEREAPGVEPSSGPVGKGGGGRSPKQSLQDWISGRPTSRQTSCRSLRASKPRR